MQRTASPSPLSLLLAMAGAACVCACSGVDTTGQDSRAVACPESPATELFGNGVCICEGLADIGNLVVGQAIATDHATLAVNGPSDFINNADIRGTFIAYGGLNAKGNVVTQGDLLSGGDVQVLGNVESRGDIAVEGDLQGIGRLQVDGTLRVGGDNRFIGYSDVADTGPYQGPMTAPCGCDAAQLFDVKAAVQDAALVNDNQAAGLPSEFSNIGFAEIHLTSGSYYFSDAANIGYAKIIVDGSVAIYVDGDVDNIGAEVLRLTSGSSLDLYVSGAVRNIGHIVLGDKEAPSAFRLYIGGTEKATVSVGNAMFNGAIYAPQAELHYVGNTKVRGALMAKQLTGTGNLVLGFAAPLPPPQECPEQDPENPETPEPEPDPSQPDPPVIL